MSIIYSYPTVQPTVDDLLIGTDVGEDNATKSFTVQSLVSLINAATGTGTVTSVQIATDAFLSATGGPITDAGTITMGLAATGTPSANTFLRGDNQWVAPIVSAGITVSNQSIPLTTDVGSFNFIGEGVTVTNVGDDITVSVPLPTSDVTSILAGTGINVSSGTGNVTISNSGVISLVSGGGLTIVEGAGGVNTLTVTGQSQGTVTAFNTGPGLELLSGTSNVNPEIGVRYSGDVTYITIPDSGDPVGTDNFAFQKGTTGVKKGTFETLQISAITAVKTYVDAADGKAVQNDTDTYTSVPTATKVITLTDTEYINLATKDASTLYLTTSTAPTTGTVQFTIDQTGITTGGTCGFTVNTTCSPAFTDSTNLTNVAIGTNYTLTSTITPTGSGCVFTGTNPQVITGTVAAGTATITQSLTGSVAVPPPSTGYATLSSVSNQIGGLPQGSAYNITQNTSQQSGTLGASFTSSTLWNVTATIPSAQQAEYYFGTNQASPSYSIAATYSPSTSTYKSGPPGQNVSATLSGTLSRKNYLMTYNIDISGITGGTLGTEYDIQLNGSYSNLITSIPTSGGTSVFSFGTNQSVTATVVPRSGFSANITGTSGTVTIGSGSNVANITLTGAISSNTGTVTLNPVTENITGPVAGYTKNYYSQLLNPNGAVTAYEPGVTPPISGTSTQSVKFTATIIKTSTDYTVTSQSFTPTTATAIVGGQNTDVAGTLTGNVILSRSSLPVSATKGSSSQACASSTNNTYYLEKASGNTLAYAQQGDTVYTSLTGTSHPSIGYYKTTIENGVTNGYMYVGSNGLISIADPCDP
jgi:hypothetical protein